MLIVYINLKYNSEIKLCATVSNDNRDTNQVIYVYKIYFTLWKLSKIDYEEKNKVLRLKCWFKQNRQQLEKTKEKKNLKTNWFKF